MELEAFHDLDEVVRALVPLIGQEYLQHFDNSAEMDIVSVGRVCQAGDSFLFICGCDFQLEFAQVNYDCMDKIWQLLTLADLVNQHHNGLHVLESLGGGWTRARRRLG